nr:diadenylate cyclase CdaA [Clostridia bacterium]
MEAIKELAAALLDSLVTQITDITITDVLDIAIVSVIFFYVIRFIRDRRAGKLAVGVILLVVFEAVSIILELATVQFILDNVFQAGLIAIIILFQPELRSMLESVGGESIKGLKSIREQKDTVQLQTMINEVCEAAEGLSATATGALIVIERGTKLGDVIRSGTVVNADTSSFLIKNIFFKNSPLHDGAMVIRGDRIYAAGCLLPLSQNADIIRDLGTRHRAAIGMSENSDAVVIVVSEETGTVSVAQGGRLSRGYDANSLRLELEKVMIEHYGVKLHGAKYLLPWMKKDAENAEDAENGAEDDADEKK